MVMKTQKSDMQLYRDLLEELEREPSIDAARIGVTVEDGIVTLTGHAGVFSERLAAEQVAKRVHGVKGVANEIEVSLADHHFHNDADLAAAAVHALQWNAKVPKDRIKVVVRDGLVILEGVVDWQYQKVAAERVLEHFVGIRGISNEIRVEHQEPSDEIQSDIEAALRRSATLNSRRITVTTNDRTVTLTGDVHSHSDMEEALRIAWAGRGVVQVENCLTITPWGTGSSEEWGY